ncbi:MAG: hypothetical protein CMD83_11825 [Gammaproteobacteria bacterium]|nr:hypothetical protein [Gammaproteobacteria bacterium]|tara:strand:+ start:2279 stop:3316 length:1038 start_codon:yes stop_codon:yes gene_type:complete
MKLSLIWLVPLLIVAANTHADPLFESDDPLGITLTGGLRALEATRDKSEQAAFSLGWTENDAPRTAPVTLELRGNNRLKRKTCVHPPLRVLFDKETRSDLKGTLFARQKRLKLVVQCQARPSNLDYLRLEYLVYKSFEQLSPASFRVRWLDVTYVDDGEASVRQGFFIEQKARLAKRLKLKDVERHSVDYADLDPLQALMTDLFMYLVGNVDYSIVKGEADEDCCHNSKLLSEKKNEPPYFPVPYDFDNSGLVNASYAMPNQALGQKRIRTRVYRGFCRFNDQLPVALGRLRATREATLALFRDDPILRKGPKKSAVTYLERLYDRFDDPKWVEKIPRSRCRGRR